MRKQVTNMVIDSSSSSSCSSSSSSPEISTSWIRGDCIGRGAYGTVNLGISKIDGRVFAVKSVDKNSCLPSQLDALENEISILRSLSSPFIVEYYADDLTIEEPEHPHSNTATRRLFRNLHMECLSGAASLANHQSTSPGSDYLLEKEAEALLRKYTWCLVSALHYVHSNGIVHCDVKPNNVLFDPTSGVAKLADFGSSKRIDIHSLSSKILPRGSPLWMAPEVVRGESQGFESDIWSLGCTIIEMVTGKPVWNHQAGMETLCKIGYSEEMPVIPMGLSESGRDFLEKCLKRDPNQRWNCDQLLQHRFLTGCSVSTTSIKIIPETTDSSPRCVFDWTTDSEVAEDKEEVTEYDSCWNSESEVEKINWSDRISKLATDSGVNWGSDGWVVVRNLTEDDSARGGDDDDEYAAYVSCFRGDEVEDDNWCQLAGTVPTILNSVDAEVDISWSVNFTCIVVDDISDSNYICGSGGCDGEFGGVGRCKSQSRTGCRCCGGDNVKEDSVCRITSVVGLYPHVFAILLTLWWCKNLRFNNNTLFLFLLITGLYSFFFCYFASTNLLILPQFYRIR